MITHAPAPAGQYRGRDKVIKFTLQEKETVTDLTLHIPVQDTINELFYLIKEDHIIDSTTYEIPFEERTLIEGSITNINTSPDASVNILQEYSLKNIIPGDYEYKTNFLLYLYYNEYLGSVSSSVINEINVSSGGFINEYKLSESSVGTIPTIVDDSDGGLANFDTRVVK